MQHSRLNKCMFNIGVITYLHWFFPEVIYSFTNTSEIKPGFSIH